jgi:hypothetical protein
LIGPDKLVKIDDELVDVEILTRNPHRQQGQQSQGEEGSDDDERGRGKSYWDL